MVLGVLGFKVIQKESAELFASTVEDLINKKWTIAGLFYDGKMHTAYLVKRA